MLRTCVRIGASECLERDRGPGGPPSGMKWSAFAEQTKKRKEGGASAPSSFPGSSPGSPTKKRDAFASLFLLGYPDSNQERQDQNLQCYHYTIAQYNAQKRCKYTAFLWNTNFLAYFLC